MVLRVRSTPTRFPINIHQQQNLAFHTKCGARGISDAIRYLFAASILLSAEILANLRPWTQNTHDGHLWKEKLLVV